MIFEKEQLAFNLLDVIELDQRNINIFNSGRNFDALSFRYCADTVLKTETQSVSLSDNSVCYVPAGLDYTRTSKNDHLIVIHFNSLNYFTKSIEFCYPRNTERLSATFKRILELWNSKPAGYKHLGSAIFCEVFAILYGEFGHISAYDKRIHSSVKYITENYSDPEISVKRAAEVSGMSEVYFRKLFKENFGSSPKKYIIDLRIKQAVNLIGSGYFTLSEISEMCGFSDSKYFSTEFRRVTGVSPSKYCYNYIEKRNK